MLSEKKWIVWQIFWISSITASNKTMPLIALIGNEHYAALNDVQRLGNLKIS
jgi:hypothetical protein